MCYSKKHQRDNVQRWGWPLKKLMNLILTLIQKQIFVIKLVTHIFILAKQVNSYLSHKSNSFN